MKNLTAILLAIVLLASCKKEKDELIGTKWTANDEFAHIFWGGKCTNSVEFLTATTCQGIDNWSNGSYIKATQGTYKHWGDSISWTIETKTIKGKISGSIILSDYWDLGSNRVYTKE